MKMADRYIAYGRQWIDDWDALSIAAVLKSDFITQGPKAKEFEERLARYCGAKYAVSVSSGTAALHVACLAAGIKQQDEVITTPMSFAATANCVLYCGGKVVFADTQQDPANIDPDKIQKKITKRTVAIIPVHYSGHPCALQEINGLARKYNLLVLEDACHALGGKYRGSKIGSCRYSDMAIFSFHPVKSITTAEGGAVLTNNKGLYERLLLLRNHGITKGKMRVLGFNYRLNDIQAALGISQLKKLDTFISRRRKIAKIYAAAFRNNPYFDIPEEREYAYCAYHLYPIRVKDEFKKRKKEIFYRLKEKGLLVQVHYMPIYFHPYYAKLGFKRGLCPNAEDFYKREISIPLFPALKDNQIRYVIQTILKVFNEFNRAR